jgi:hypothetical protein
MGKSGVWIPRVVATITALLCLAWVWFAAGQWILRWRGERLLKEIVAIQPGVTRYEDAKAILRKWGKADSVEESCSGDACGMSLVTIHRLPINLSGDPEQDSKTYLLRLIDHLGLRNEGVGAVIRSEHGLVTAMDFDEDISLPVRDWYVRGGAYVPELLVGSGETSHFTEFQTPYLKPGRPNRIAKFMKGPFGLEIFYTPQETPAERAALMDFRFSCLTQFIPCESEGQILPEGWRTLQGQ